MRKENTFNPGWDENLICRSLEFFATQKIGMTLLFCLSSGVTHAECVPAPDCLELGYTETSCDGDSLKCPFDISKLYCIPCDSVYQYSCSNAGEIGKGNSCNGKYIECGCADGYEVDGTGCKLSCASSYQYTCTGTNEIGGYGTACGGKYKSCTCTSGYKWKNGACICDTSCTVANIMYSDKTCNSCIVSGKTPIGIIVKDNELIWSKTSSSKMFWSNTIVDTSLNNLSFDQAKNDYNGESNTTTIIAEDSNNIAAKYCNDYTTAGTSAGDWYLPASGEIYSYVYGNYNAIKTTMTSIGWTWENYYLWSSSESYLGSSYCMAVSTSGGIFNYGKNTSNAYVSCFLKIN